MAPPQHWLIKSEPSEYAYAQLEQDGRTAWTGIRSFEARKHLRAMRPGDLALYYHTGGERAVVGLATVSRAAFPDPTAPKGEEWDAVEIAPRQPLRAPVPLSAMKADRALKGLPLLTRGRLSVMPVSPEHFQHILEQAKGPVKKPSAPRKR
jgi:predicted RNA-binding protein with PUA-like domain